MSHFSPFQTWKIQKPLIKATNSTALKLSDIARPITARHQVVTQHFGVKLFANIQAPANVDFLTDIHYTWTCGKSGSHTFDVIEADFPNPLAPFNDANVVNNSHVCETQYDEPGDYTAICMMEWINPFTGVFEAHFEEFTITVVSFDDRYPGAKKVAVAQDGDFSELPAFLAGAQQVTTFAAARALVQSGGNTAEAIWCKAGEHLEVTRNTDIHRITRDDKDIVISTWYPTGTPQASQTAFEFRSTIRDPDGAAMNVMNIENNSRVLMYDIRVMGLYDATQASRGSALLRGFFSANCIGVTINKVVMDGVSIPVHITSGGADANDPSLARASDALIINCEFGRQLGHYDYGCCLGNGISQVAVWAKQPEDTLSGPGGKNNDAPDGELFADHGISRLTSAVDTLLYLLDYRSANGWSSNGLAFQASHRHNMAGRISTAIISMCRFIGGVSQLALTRTTENVYVYPCRLLCSDLWLEGDHESVRSIHIGNGGTTLRNIHILKRDEVDTWNPWLRVIEVENFPGGGEPAALNAPIVLEHFTVISLESDPPVALQFVENSFAWPGPIIERFNNVYAPNHTNAASFPNYLPQDADGVPQAGSAAISGAVGSNVLYDILRKRRASPTTIGAFDVEVATTVNETGFQSFATENPGNAETYPGLTLGSGTGFAFISGWRNAGAAEPTSVTITGPEIPGGLTGTKINDVQFEAATGKSVFVYRFDGVIAGTYDLDVQWTEVVGRSGGVIWTFANAGTVEFRSGTTNDAPTGLNVSGPALVDGGALCMYSQITNGNADKTAGHAESSGLTITSKFTGVFQADQTQTASQVLPTTARAADTYSITHTQPAQNGNSNTITVLMSISPSV